MYPLVTDTRITWYVNNHEGRNTIGLGAYWGYLIGALDQRNLASSIHAPLDVSSQSAVEESSGEASNDEENASKSNTKSDEEKSQSSIFTLMSTLSSRSNGQPMPTNSMPNIHDRPNRPSVIVPNIVQPAYQPPPVLVPAEDAVMQDWAADVVDGESYL